METAFREPQAASRVRSAPLLRKCRTNTPSRVPGVVSPQLRGTLSSIFGTIIFFYLLDILACVFFAAVGVIAKYFCKCSNGCMSKPL